MNMKNNIGATDRRTRIVVGLAVGLVGLAILGDLLALGTVVGAALSLVGLVLVGTGLVRVCLLYRLLGIDTSRSR
ncbi:YgaP family membrane protein [Haloplanus salilacus]|uniref:YgaP family membrane protein n=1 Tax=Haloplanus salilacus TaxID=2949994 RepID=UPI003CCE4F1B